MSDTQPKDLNSQTVPFFARFLECQNCENLTEEQSAAVSGGTILGTIKFPAAGRPFAVTLKYPSDNEDSVTLKYPSDNDEYAVTQKYPSDGDDESSEIIE